VGSVEEFVDEVQSLVGREVVRRDSTAPFEVDWTGRFGGPTPAVLLPRSTAEVASIVSAARRHRVALVPQGGNTGLVGGGVPGRGEVVVSLRRLTDVGAVDPLSRQLTVGAGVTLQEVHEAASRSGLRYPVDFGARGTATIGGTVATNAGGVNVVRHGMTRRHVVGIEAVLGNGDVVSRLTGLVKDNTGYDLAGLLCGSEGTLGIVTKVRLQLAPAPSSRVIFLVAIASVGEAMRLVGELANVEGVEAVEIMDRFGLDLVTRLRGTTVPVSAETHLLVEVDGPHADEAQRIIGEHVGDQVAVAVTAAQSASLWRLREEHTPSIQDRARERDSVPLKFDVTVPLGAIAAFVVDVRRSVEEAWPSAETYLFGHAADGNLHVNVVGEGLPTETVEHRVTEAVLALVSRAGGSISAEHGIGVAKREWIALTRSAAEIDAMRAVKRALDPDGVLNPGVLLPPD